MSLSSWLTPTSVGRIIAGIGSGGAIIAALAKVRLRHLLWFGALMALAAVCIVEGRHAAFVIKGVLVFWLVSTYRRNRRHLRVAQSKRPHDWFERPAVMNWLLLTSLVSNLSSIAFRLYGAQAASIASTGIVGLLAALAARVIGLGAGTRNMASNEPAAAVFSRLLYALYFPEWFGKESKFRFAPVIVAAVFVAVLSQVSTLSGAWQQTTDSVNARIFGQKHQRPNERESHGVSPKQPRIESDADSDTATPRCRNAKLIASLSSRALPPAQVARVVEARGHFGSDAIGCNVMRVDFYEHSLYVVFGHGRPGVVVDNRRSATAVINASAIMLISQVQRITARRFIRGVLGGDRAAVGRWYLEQWSDGGCRLLENRDHGITSALTFGETTRAIDRAYRLKAFPMVSAQSGGRRSVEYYVGDSASPNGYRRVSTDVYVVSQQADLSATTCLRAQRVLDAISRQLNGLVP